MSNWVSFHSELFIESFFSFIFLKDVCVDWRDTVKQRRDCIGKGSSVLSLLMPAKMNISVQEPTHIESVYINSLFSFCSLSVLSLTRTQTLFIQTHTHTQTLFMRSLSHLWRACLFFLKLCSSRYVSATSVNQRFGGVCVVSVDCEWDWVSWVKGQRSAAGPYSSAAVIRQWRSVRLDPSSLHRRHPALPATL